MLSGDRKQWDKSRLLPRGMEAGHVGTWDLGEGGAGILRGHSEDQPDAGHNSEPPTRRVGWAGPEDHEEDSPKEAETQQKINQGQREDQVRSQRRNNFKGPLHSTDRCT